MRHPRLVGSSIKQRIETMRAVGTARRSAARNRMNRS